MKCRVIDCGAIKGAMALKVEIPAQGILNSKREYGTVVYRENTWNIMSEEPDARAIHGGSFGSEPILTGYPNNGQMTVQTKPPARDGGRP